MKRYNLRCNYCGTDNYTFEFLILLKLLIHGKIYSTCKNCGLTSNYTLIKHIVHNTTDIKEKDFNKNYTEKKKRLWENG